MNTPIVKTTLQKVQAILASEFSVPEESIKPEAALTDLGVDSLGAIEVLFKVEDEFNIRIPQGHANEVTITTVQDIVTAVDRLVAERQGSSVGTGAKQ